MAYARWQATIVDEHGNLMPGASVLVQRETAGLPTAVIYSDRAGAAKSNPFTADADTAYAFFHAAGSSGGYRITATLGPRTITWYNVGVGLAAESDIGEVPGITVDNTIPRFDGLAGALQTSGIAIDDSDNLLLPTGTDINWASSDVTITHSINALAFAGATNGYSFDNKVYPVANDGAAIGDTTHGFSDAFFATGAVINYNNGDVTITHSANALAFAGASSGYSFDASLLLASTTAINFNAGDVTITHSSNALAFAGASSGYSFDASVLMASGTAINFNAGDVTITHSANVLAFAGASSGYSFDAHVLFSEIASPSNPSANNLAVFAKDVGGDTHLFTRDSAGTEVDLSTGGSGGAAAASQATMEAATSTAEFSSPGRQHFHPGHPKFWVKANISGGVVVSHNVPSVSDGGAGVVTVTIGTDFSSADYHLSGSNIIAAGARVTNYSAQAAGTCTLNTFNVAATAADPDNFFAAGHGDQA